MPKIMCVNPWHINDCICGECLRNGDLITNPDFCEDFQDLAPLYQAPMHEDDCKHFWGKG